MGAMAQQPQGETRARTVSCKVTQSEEADLRFVADADQTTVSDLLRGRTLPWVVARAEAIRANLPAPDPVEVTV